MKTKSKALLLALCVVLLVAASVLGTLAYLTSQAEVKNTFTVGKVGITMTESKVDPYGVPVANAERVTENTYKLIPGKNYTKDPTIYVDGHSETCWLFVEIKNELGEAGTIFNQDGWTQISGTDYWAYSSKVEAGAGVKVFGSFTFGNADPAAYEGKTIAVTAYAIQADGFTTSDAAWTALKGQLELD